MEEENERILEFAKQQQKREEDRMEKKKQQEESMAAVQQKVRGEIKTSCKRSIRLNVFIGCGVKGKCLYPPLPPKDVVACVNFFPRSLTIARNNYFFFHCQPERLIYWTTAGDGLFKLFTDIFSSLQLSKQIEEESEAREEMERCGLMIIFYIYKIYRLAL